MSRPLPVWHLTPPTASSRMLVFSGNELIGEDATSAEPMFRYADLTRLGTQPLEPILVARWNDEDVYAVALAEPPAEFSRRGLHSVLSAGQPDFAALASTALQLLHWQRDNRFCGRCGAATRLHAKERAFFCDSCQHRFFPRLSPCVIVAIRRRGQVLLAQSHFSAGKFYSLIAGFVEPGESAEEAVHREVLEETGLSVTNLRYVESQSWAFPHQLMLGYVVDYLDGDLVLEQEELATADWFDEQTLPTVPGRWTIAGRLIQAALSRDIPE
ncbi:MAG: NAD(+) diphosphatase [Alteromonadaceae bacterium]|nr:NAD(+) diphosphatase [Alteromonadaceae bacterium]|tara:strand:- start:1709 stop:2521 length:813 start_codon:yes stop_codon:yes gene_type:complete